MKAREADGEGNGDPGEDDGVADREHRKHRGHPDPLLEIASLQGWPRFGRPSPALV